MSVAKNGSSPNAAISTSTTNAASTMKSPCARLTSRMIEQTVASGLIYLNSSARDFKNPDIRPYLDKYMRGSKATAPPTA